MEERKNIVFFIYEVFKQCYIVDVYITLTTMQNEVTTNAL